MIISASYKTDIPAFYGRWFQNRLDAGFCRVVNPYNQNQHQFVSLCRNDVDGFVFWTKNLTPFLDTLENVNIRGYPFLIQYTINGYPRALESRVVDTERSITSFADAAEKYGQKTCVWRYDTIIFSTLTDVDFHLHNFENIARKLENYTDEVVVSFLQVYSKTRKNLNAAARDQKFDWHDPAADVKRSLLMSLAQIASDRGMRLSICSQPDLTVAGVGDARCIDAHRLIEVGERPFNYQIKGMRVGCGCFASKDIGDYDTCPHGCVYCYAVRDRSVALQRHRSHDPTGEFLFPQKTFIPEETSTGAVEADGQLSLLLPTADS